MKCIKKPHVQFSKYIVITKIINFLSPKLSQQNICSHVFHFLPRCQRISFIFMSRKYEISLCHISYLNFQCIFEFDKNDFACKGHMVLTNDSRFIKIKHDHLTYKTRQNCQGLSQFFVFKIALYTLSRVPIEPASSPEELS